MAELSATGRESGRADDDDDRALLLGEPDCNAEGGSDNAAGVPVTASDAT